MPNDYEDNDTAVGVNLRRLRLKANMTQQQLAERIGWQRIAVAQAEAGKRRFRIDDLAALCSGLGVSYRALMVGQEDTLHALDPYRRSMQRLIVAALGDGSEEEPTPPRRPPSTDYDGLRDALMHATPSGDAWRRQMMRWMESVNAPALPQGEEVGADE